MTNIQHRTLLLGHDKHIFPNLNNFKVDFCVCVCIFFPSLCLILSLPFSYPYQKKTMVKLTMAA